ncbi:MAG TPA: diguanylate cyclase [Thermoanaerobaculia bacterium]
MSGVWLRRSRTKSHPAGLWNRAAQAAALALVLSIDAFALDPSRALGEYTQRRWSVEHGLPQVSVTSIVQDREGYLWIGTFGGLVRFDGVTVTAIPSRCSARILSLGLDPEGELWVGTERSGLCVVRNGVLVPFAPPDGQDIGGVAEIRPSRAGGILAATVNGLVRTGPAFSRVTTAQGLPHDNVMTADEQPDGSILVGTRQGLCLYLKGRCIAPGWSDPLAGIMVETIHRSVNGTIWIGTEKGLYRRQGDSVERIACDSCDGRVRAILEDRDGGLWIGLYEGGVRRIMPRIETLRDREKTAPESIYDLFEDREGNLWVGTGGDGILKLGEGLATGVEIRHNDEILSVLPVVPEGGGHAWVGTRCAGLARVTPLGTRLYGIGDGLANQCVWSLLLDRSGTLWIGSYGDGLYWRKPDGSIERAGGPVTPENLVRAIAEQDERWLLVGTDAGLFRFDRIRRTFELVETTASLDVFFIDARAGDEEVWLGARQGLRVLTNEGLRTIELGPPGAVQTVRAIHRDRAGVAWIGTYGGGLVRLQGDEAFVFNSRHGLVDPAISRILEDDHGRFWLSGNRGVTRVARSELDEVALGKRERVSIDLFDVSDGMPSTETNGGGQPAGSIDRDGVLWIPTLSGVALFDTRRSVRNRVGPPVQIVRVRVNGREIDRHSEHIQLPADARNLEINYTALSFKAPEKVRFRYRLEGFDDQWIDAGNQRAVSYASIPKGNLSFHVIASNEDGVWNEVGDRFTFTMKPHPLETWWVYLLGALLLVALVALIHRGRLKRAAARETALKFEVERRTAELARLAKLTEIINAAVTLEDVLDHLYENLREIVPYDRIGLALLDEDRIVLRAVWSRGERTATGIEQGYEAPVAGSSLAPLLDTGTPRVIDDLEAYLAEHPDSESTRRILSEGIRSSLTCPLRALGRPVGFIFFSSFEPNTYKAAHVDFLSQIAGHLSLIIGKSRLYEDLLATKGRLESANRELELLASADGLTGLANRRAFDERLDSEWRRAAREGTPLSLLMLDVDLFKALNDRYGHATGDGVLRAIAEVLAGLARRAADLPARYGGEEFAVVLPQCGQEAAAAFAETIRDSVERLAISHEASPTGVLSISIGVATMVPGLGDHPTALIEAADSALYEAKRAGRNRVISCSDGANL